MATTETNRKCQAYIKVNTQTAQDPKYAKRYLGSGYVINPDATLDNLEEAGEKFAALQENLYQNTHRKYECTLEEEE